MNLPRENHLSLWNKIPEFILFKDNRKRWSYENLEDELGFAVIDFEF